jgi:hypothetical protein
MAKFVRLRRNHCLVEAIMMITRYRGMGTSMGKLRKDAARGGYDVAGCSVINRLPDGSELARELNTPEEKDWR